MLRDGVRFAHRRFRALARCVSASFPRITETGLAFRTPVRTASSGHGRAFEEFREGADALGDAAQVHAQIEWHPEHNSI
jgi:hypothetical protein